MQFLKTLFGKPDTTMQQVQSDTVTLEYHKMVIEAHKDEVKSLRAEICAADTASKMERRRADLFGKRADGLLAERDAAGDALEFARVHLRMIASLETPGCAHVGKRMARIAREALPEYAEAVTADRRAVALARLAENDAPYIGSAAPAR